jgi:hypothetical protein
MVVITVAMVILLREFQPYGIIPVVVCLLLSLKHIFTK